MRLNEKARENLEAVERLLQSRDGDLESLNNAAASRAYYVAYQATADRAQQAGLAFDSEKDYYRHDSLPDLARDQLILDEEQAADLSWLHSLRIKADYLEETVVWEEANNAAECVRAFAAAILKDRQ